MLQHFGTHHFLVKSIQHCKEKKINGHNGIHILRDSIERNQVTLIATPSREDSLKQRMAIYDQQADDQDIKAYVNVGGNTITLNIDCVMT